MLRGTDSKQLGIGSKSAAYKIIYLYRYYMYYL
jgi:hypothetical protein